jgi:pyruvate carboxylase subunit B
VPELEEKEERRENIPVEFVITVHGEQYHVQIAGRGEPTQDGRTFFIRLDGRLEEVLLKPVRELSPTEVVSGDLSSLGMEVKPKRSKPVALGDVASPISGKIVNIKVKPGDEVKEGDVLFVVEAMKMENEVHSPISGVVEEVLAQVGETVNPDEVVVRIKPKT